MAGASALEDIDPRLLDLDAIEAELARRLFWEFFRLLNPDLLVGWWQEDAAAELQRFYDAWQAGLKPILALSAPPQHGKSVLVAHFIAWCLGKAPNCRAGFASYSEYLGVRTNLKIQRIMDSETYRRVFPDSRLFSEQVVTQVGKPRRNSRHLELVGHEGSFRNTTVRGAIGGESLDLAVIDDPVKGHEEAESFAAREKIWDWYQDDFRTRLSEDGAVLCVMTRWNLDDLEGRMIEQDPDVRVVRYQAIATADEPHRKKGEALFPELKSLGFLEKQRKRMHAASWEALYQQNPVPREGAVVKHSWLKERYMDRGAKPLRVVQSWDTASKAGDRNAASGGLTIAEFPDRLELWHAGQWRLEVPELIQAVIEHFEKWRTLTPGGVSVVLIEDRSSGEGLVQHLRRNTRIPVIAVNPGQLDKVKRLELETPVIASGNLWLPSGGQPWVADFVAQLTTFPGCALKDMVDALSQALHWIRFNPIPGPSSGPVSDTRSSRFR